MWTEPRWTGSVQPAWQSLQHHRPIRRRAAAERMSGGVTTQYLYDGLNVARELYVQPHVIGANDSSGAFVFFSNGGANCCWRTRLINFGGGRVTITDPAREAAKDFIAYRDKIGIRCEVHHEYPNLYPIGWLDRSHAFIAAETVLIPSAIATVRFAFMESSWRRAGLSNPSLRRHQRRCSPATCHGISRPHLTTTGMSTRRSARRGIRADPLPIAARWVTSWSRGCRGGVCPFRAACFSSAASFDSLRRREAQRAFQAGLRFSRNARTPSLASSL